MKLPAISKNYRNAFVLTPIIAKIATVAITILVFHSFIDMFDYGNYYLAMQNIAHGSAPWAGDTSVYYPPLALVPMMISYILSLVIGGSLGFTIVMWILIAICDIVTTFCVYYIGVKLHASGKTAFVAAMLYAISIPVAYFSLTKFDSFPTCVMMLAILFTIYGEKIKGYYTSVAGFFIKLYPAVIFPFLWVYNARDSNLISEGKRQVIWVLLPASAAFVLMMLLGYNLLLGYASLVFCNTIQYALIQHLQFFGIIVQDSTLAIVFRILQIGVVLGALYYFYTHPKTISLLLKTILLSLVAVIFLHQYRSPQYVVWLAPLFALLLADNLEGAATLFCVQFLSFVEFPLAFWFLYTNDKYVTPWAVIFFTIYFIAYGVLLWKALNFKEYEGAIT
jgi:hypothetical protein